YTDKTFTKKIKLIKALQEPTIRVYKNDGNDFISSSSSAPEESGYSAYTCYDMPLTASGTGHANFEVTAAADGESVSVKVDGANVSTYSSGKRKLELGGHTITFTVAKTGYKTQVFTEKVYIQGTLADPEIKSTNATLASGSGNSNSDPQVWKFSYINYDSLKCYINPGNTGNTVVVHKDTATGTTLSNPTTGFGLGFDSTIKLVIVQSKSKCKTLTTTKYVQGKIKPITLSYNNNNGGTGMLFVWLSGFNKNKFDMKGRIEVNGNVVFSYLGSNRDNVNQNTWQELGDSGDPSFAITCYSPYDDIVVSVNQVRRNVGGGKDDPDDSGFAGSCTKTLDDLKSQKTEKTKWVLLSDTISGKSRSIRPKIFFNVSE
ncbi:MAG: hypothetical protein IJM03_03320, partial [Treponema sp.]|nr:hypothetical protein [Treponema sp.]